LLIDCRGEVPGVLLEVLYSVAEFLSGPKLREVGPTPDE